MLPAVEMGNMLSRPLRYAAVAAALLGVTWFAFEALRPRAVHQHAPPEFWMGDGSPFLPSPAFGHEATQRARSPRYPLLADVDPTQVGAGRWTYEQHWITDGVFTSPQGQRVITVAAGSYQGRPAWVVMGSSTAETVFVDPATLRPLRHARYGKQGLLIREFAPDSVSEQRNSGMPPTEQRVQGAAALPGPADTPYLISWSPYSLEVLAPALPLARGWRGSVYTVNWITVTSWLPAFTPLDLRVTGAQRVTVPAGSFDCWKVEVREDDRKSIVWVSKDRHWVIMRQQTSSDPDSGDWRQEARLVSVDTASTPRAP
ncbi:MAG TPA: hypothetical protein VM716_08650 [Gemmatimonadales bacterium]|nr:hypothetical protein [Gemmatimonadales bacterium]